MQKDFEATACQYSTMQDFVGDKIIIISISIE